jgi:hypothetical protein
MWLAALSGGTCASVLCVRGLGRDGYNARFRLDRVCSESDTHTTFSRVRIFAQAVFLPAFVVDNTTETVTFAASHGMPYSKIGKVRSEGMYEACET